MLNENNIEKPLVAFYLGSTNAQRGEDYGENPLNDCSERKANFLSDHHAPKSYGLG